MPKFLSYEQIESYKEKGYMIVRGQFTKEEVAIWHKESDRLLSLHEIIDPLNLRIGFRKMDGKPYVEKFDPLTDISPVFKAVAEDERIVSPLRDLYYDEPLLFKDKLIFKFPGVSGYTMHQDASWWQGFPYEGLISVMIAVDGATKENGGLELFPGYHDRLRSTPGELRNMNQEEIDMIDASKGELVETEPGDMIIFHSLTPHQSGPNKADSSRRQLYLTYSPSKNGQLYKAQYQHFHRYATIGQSDEQLKQRYFK